MTDLFENNILNSITALYDKREKLFAKPEVLVELTTGLTSISEFFGTDIKTAAVLGVLICGQLRGENSSIKKTTRVLSLDSIDAINANEVLKQFRTKGWLRFNSKSYLEGGQECEMSNDVLAAIMKNDPGRLEVKIPDELHNALFIIRRIIHTTRNEDSQDIDIEDVLASVERYNKFPFIDKILNARVLQNEEKFLLIFFGTEVLFDREDFNLNEVLENYGDASSEMYMLMHDIKSGRSALMREGFLRFSKPDLADFTAVRLSDELMQEILDSGTNAYTKVFSSKYCQVLEPLKIPEQTLYFNSKNKEAIDTILGFTSQEKFVNLEAKFKSMKMNPGLTVMFYGLPGTGKTELVKQIGRMHNRAILQVDIASIKNMWVGESEKNMKNVFRDYQKALKHFKNTPILLFNEADAILGERRQVQSAVDQMLNAMQNILLQELEDFQGIFIATTNLINNIDQAFDRRMLYKINFEHPNEETRYQILQSNFPEFASELLNDISRTSNLSGGQIRNIQKKFLIDRVLLDDANGDAIQLRSYIVEETKFRQAPETRIGFGNQR